MMDTYQAHPIGKSALKSGLILAVFILAPLALFCGSLITHDYLQCKAQEADFVDRWSNIASVISARASMAIDENLLIDDDFASDLYLLPSFLNEIEIIKLVDQQNRSIFTVGESVDRNNLLLESGAGALSGEKSATLPRASGSNCAIFSFPVIREGKIAAAVVLGVNDGHLRRLNRTDIAPTMIKSSGPFIIWVVAVIIAAVRMRKRREKEESLKLAEMRLASMGYSFEDSGRLSEASLDVLITTLRLVDATIYLKDPASGDIVPGGHISTSKTAGTPVNSMFDPADPRLLAMEDKTPQIYSLSRLGHARLIRRTDQTERSRRLALPLLVEEDDVIGLLDLGVGRTTKLDREFLDSCCRFSARIAESLHGLIGRVSAKKEVMDMQDLLDAVEAVNSSSDLSSALGKITRKIIETKNVRFCRIFTVDEGGVNLTLLAETWTGEGINAVDPGRVYNLDEMPIHKIAMLSGQSQVLRPEDIASHIGYLKDVHHPGMERCTILIVPLPLGENLFGCLSVGIDRLTDFPAELRIRLENLARYLSNPINKAQSCARLTRSIDKISLTQNRVVQNERLSAIADLSRGLSENLDSLLDTFRENLKALKGRSNDGRMSLGIDSMEEAMESYSRIVARFRTFVEIGKSDALRHIELAQLVSEASKELSDQIRKYAAGGKEIRLILKVVGSGQIFGDRENLKTMIRELLINSAEAMPEGGNIILETRVELDFAVLEIIDQGKGMANDVKNMIFEPFFTTKEGSGRGLGMSMVYGIVTSHMGSIDILSEAGKGTRIVIKIPLVDPEQTSLYNIKKATTKSIPLSLY